MAETMKAMSWTKTWFLALRPWAFSASIAPVVLGMALAVYAGHGINWLLFVLSIAGVVCFHAAANLLNDYFDHRKGIDTEVYPTSGAIVRGMLSDKQVFRAGLLFMAVGTACGLALVYTCGRMILLLGVLGAALVMGYTRAGFCLKYAGLGDLAIFISFGILPVFGSYWVQARSFSWLPVIWSLPLVSYTVGILHANNWRDISNDTAKDCRTMASMLGQRGSGIYYRILLLGPFALVLLYLALEFILHHAHLAPLTSLLVFAALPMAVKLANADRDRNMALFQMLDARTAQMGLLFGILLTIAFLTVRLLERF